MTETSSSHRDEDYLTFANAEVIIDDPKWQSHGALPNIIEDVIKRVLTDEFEISILLTNDGHIQHLNKDFRGQDKPTNILSFPSDEEKFLGDIAIAYDTMVREAEEQDKDFYHHFTHILIHGVLHLQGYDHIAESDATEMETSEIKILEDMGIKNPYI